MGQSLRTTQAWSVRNMPVISRPAHQMVSQARKVPELRASSNSMRSVRVDRFAVEAALETLATGASLDSACISIPHAMRDRSSWLTRYVANPLRSILHEGLLGAFFCAALWLAEEPLAAR